MADLPPPSDPPNGIASENLGPSKGSKRQRRPSVRLGEIGEPSAAATVSYAAYLRRNKQWKLSTHPHLPPISGKAAKPRRLLGNGDFQGTHDLLDEKTRFGVELDSSMGARKGKRGSTAAIKRPRTNWVSRVDDGDEGEHEKLTGEGDGAGEDEGFRDYEAEGLETPSKENSPNCSTENPRPPSDKAHGSEKEGNFPRRTVRARCSEVRDSDGVELDAPSDMDGGDWRGGGSMERNGGGDRAPMMLDDEGVRAWLNRLGLGRYAQVFEIHEVDDEVLPMLTLEDLKDMGINAVGSRRKMYCSIQKLRKGFS